MIYPELPLLALSIRQPWAWAIIHAGKNIENRNWKLPRQFASPKRVCVHASKGMTQDEYDDARQFMIDAGLPSPSFPRPQKNYMDLGGIIGSVLITGCVQESASPYFFGKYGFTLSDPQPCDFIPVAGKLSFFEWRSRVIGGEA